MLSKIISGATLGVHALPVDIEVDVAKGLPAINVVGLPDAAIREAKHRVKSALLNSGFPFPSRRMTINLAPAHIKKTGPQFDLPIALGILLASDVMPAAELTDTLVLGELALDGSVRGIRGALPVVRASQQQGLARRVLIPAENAQEAALVRGIEVLPVRHLREAAAFLADPLAIPPYVSHVDSVSPIAPNEDLTDIRGQHHAKRALEIVAAGAHHVVFIGPPGAGKTMLSARLPWLFPPMTSEEQLEVTTIHSVAGMLRAPSLMSVRPFRAPHHTSSTMALVGGGPDALPGEVSLAHHGILFLDEWPEFHRDALQALREPLEHRAVTICRARHRTTFPAHCLLVASMNPCPCGYLTHPNRSCRCSSPRIQRYLNKISGPLLDRVDVHVPLPPPAPTELTGHASGPSSADVQHRVMSARARQRRRYHGTAYTTNAEIPLDLLRARGHIRTAAEQLLIESMEQLQLSARAFVKVLRLARTIADVEGVKAILERHVAEAIQYRTLDREWW